MLELAAAAADGRREVRRPHRADPAQRRARRRRGRTAARSTTRTRCTSERQGACPADDELSERAEASLRAPWFEVSCCPTNVARTLASVGSYFASVDHDGVQLHQFADVDIDTVTGDGTPVALTVRTGYPYDGDVVITVAEAGEFTVSVRIPPWAADATAHLGDDQLAVDAPVLRVRRSFAAGDTLTLRLPMLPRVSVPDARIDAVRGTVAIERGPLVLCLESTDLPDGVALDDVFLTDADLRATGRGAIATLQRRRSSVGGLSPWPYGVENTQPENGEVDGGQVDVELQPYFHWANRGPSTMRVWIPVGLG